MDSGSRNYVGETLFIWRVFLLIKGVNEKQQLGRFCSRLYQPDKNLVSDIAGKMYEQSQANSLLPSLSDSSSTHTTSGFISPPSF